MLTQIRLRLFVWRAVRAITRSLRTYHAHRSDYAIKDPSPRDVFPWKGGYTYRDGEWVWLS